MQNPIWQFRSKKIREYIPASIAALLFVWTIVIMGAGVLIGHSVKRHVIIANVEETIQKSIEQGNPFMFHDGRIGVILKTHFMKNGKTIAYRAISFVYPQEDEKQNETKQQSNATAWRSP
jgi:hypothetical protein